MGATEASVHAALSRQDVKGAVVSSGAGTALIRQTLACDVGAGLAFVLHRTVVTQQAVQAQSGEGQRQQEGGQEPVWSHQMDVQTNVNPHTQLDRNETDWKHTYAHINCPSQSEVLWVPVCVGVLVTSSFFEIPSPCAEKPAERVKTCQPEEPQQTPAHPLITKHIQVCLWSCLGLIHK